MSAAALAADAAVSAWLTPGGSKLLSAYVLRDDGAKSIRFTNEVGALAQQQEATEAEMHLIRLDAPTADAQQAVSVEEFAKRVLITNTAGDAVQGLYEIIHSVFGPKLLGCVTHAHTHIHHDTMAAVK